MRARDPWLAAAPILFVLLWSTGFIGAKLGLPYAEPLTFLLLRFVAASALILPVVLLMRASWPGSLREVAHISVAGLLIHAAYLSGVYLAIAGGTPAGVVALITSLQPLLAAVAGRTAAWRTGRPAAVDGALVGLARGRPGGRRKSCAR